MSGLPANSVLANKAEPSAARKALTAVVLAVLLCAAVVVQLTVVNRLPLPGGAAPDLVLLLVTAIAVCTSPLAGALAGFAGGLALDVAPPSIHYAGEYALVFCLAGWGAARVNRAITDVRGERDQVVTFAVMAGAAAAGEAGKAALGMMLSDPDVTAAVVGRLLPTAVLYDVLVAPFAFWLVARVTRGADAERAPAPEFSVEQRVALVFRSASAGAAAGLRLAGTGQNYFQPPTAGRVPRLRLSSGHAGSSIPAGAAARGAAVHRPGGRAPRLSFGGDLPARTGQARTGRRASRAPGKDWLRGATGVALAGSPALKAQAAAAARRTAHRPGRGWLRAAGPAGPAVPPAQRAPRLPGKGWISSAGSAGGAEPSATRVPRLPGKGWITAGRLAGPARGPRADPAGAGLVPRAPAAAASRARAVHGLRRTPWPRDRPPLACPRCPAAERRWPPAVSVAAGRSAPPPSAPPPSVAGRAYRGNWYAAPPSGEWLRRGRHPWRRRSQRLLRLVGVGR